MTPATFWTGLTCLAIGFAIGIVLGALLGANKGAE